MTVNAWSRKKQHALQLQFHNKIITNQYSYISLINNKQYVGGYHSDGVIVNANAR